jgi:hypothetical protein
MQIERRYMEEEGDCIKNIFFSHNGRHGSIQSVSAFFFKNALFLFFGLVLLSIGETQVKSCVSLVKRPVFHVFRRSL